MKKIKDFFLKLFYGLPYGLKGADSEIMGGGTKDTNGTSITQEVSDERVAKHLLKGEVTQEVEELRYRTHRVENESKNFKYLGNGVAVKEDSNTNENNTKFRFSQDNENICESISETLKQVGHYGVERYRFEIGYNFFIRFKLERYATRIDVNINEDKDLVETTLHFSSEPNPYDAVSKPFINELEKLMNTNSKYELEKNDIASSIKEISFVTYKADNEDDMVTYGFVNGGKFKSIRKENYEYLITYTWDEYMRLPLNLETKYYSKSMAEKYERKERKNTPIEMGQMERKKYCSVCGKEMSIYDADIQEADGQEIVCKECMKKAFNNK